MTCIIPHDRVPLILKKGFVLYNKAAYTTVFFRSPLPLVDLAVQEREDIRSRFRSP